MLLGRQSNHGHEGRGCLEHVVTGHVLWGGADGDWRVEHLQTNLGPLAERVQVDTPVNQRLGEITTAGLEGVGADRHGSGDFVRLQKLDKLSQQEKSR